ncbi:MAG: phosphoenolpyruvate--protein phosphotransferase [Chlamydiia bacterium]|nr:phosphoenolpyruvate--protein phosphotransferase [Chlamydiia bacterium]
MIRQHKPLLNSYEIRLEGYPICTGIAIGKPFMFNWVDEQIHDFTIPSGQIESEVRRWYQALKSSRRDVLTLQKKLRKEGGEEGVKILGAHLEMLQDPLMTVQMEEKIRTAGKNTESVFKAVITEYEQKFHRITDQFFRERFKDFQDITRRIFGHLLANEKCPLSEISQARIIFAHELSPSDTAEAKLEYIEAFVTRSGAETSHVAIMARSLGIPFVTNVNFPNTIHCLPHVVIVDGEKGIVILNPKPKTTEEYLEKKKKLKIEVHYLSSNKEYSAETIDGYRTKISINVEMTGDIDAIPTRGGEGIGLFRSEYLFLAKDTFPTEEDQFAVYRELVEKVNGDPCVIRTFDIGGDKFGNFHPVQYEKNPYLGCRAIRLMLKERAAFKTQLRAIIRASAFGEINILFPMISGLPELLASKEIFEEAKEELAKEGFPFSRTIPIGCMIEIPSAALTIDLLAPECDFLSIGTNDLVQYSLAVDRNNPSLSYLYKSSHPSILRMIKMIVTEGRKANKPVSVCGEIAGDPLYTALLLGLGVNEFSVAHTALPLVKNCIRNLCYVDTVDLAQKALTFATAEEVEIFLKQEYAKMQAQFPSTLD